MEAPDNFSIEIQPYCKNCNEFEVHDDVQVGVAVYYPLDNVKRVIEPAKHIIRCKYSKRCEQIYERIKEELSNEGS